MGPCNCTVAHKFFEIAQVLGLSTKYIIYHCFTFFGHFSKKKLSLAHFVCANFLNRNFGHAKKITFRKSGVTFVLLIMQFLVLVMLSCWG